MAYYPNMVPRNSSFCKQQHPYHTSISLQQQLLTPPPAVYEFIRVSTLGSGSCSALSFRGRSFGVLSPSRESGLIDLTYFLQGALSILTYYI
jgi:hypothetical protein